MSDDTYIATLVASVEGWIVKKAIELEELFGWKGQDDLKQEGRLAAFERAQKYDASRGVFFLRFAQSSIYFRMWGYACDNARSVRIPERFFFKAPLAFDSLDGGNDELYQDGPRGEIITELLGAAAIVDGRDEIGRDDAHTRLAEALQTLDDRAREILTRRFFRNQTLKEVGAALGVTGECIRQQERDALRSLRFRLKDLAR